MKAFENFTNLYSNSKTLRFGLIPEGDTLSNIEKTGILAEDERLAEDFKKVKKIADEWLKAFINESLAGRSLNLEDLLIFEEKYNIFPRDEKDEEEFNDIKAKLRKEIVSYLAVNPKFKLLGSADLVRKELPDFAKTEEDKNLINKFKTFTTYFTNYHKTRENIYSAEEKHASYAYRIINENLPLFIVNKKNFEIIKNSYPELIEDIKKSTEPLLNGEKVENMFSLEWFSNTLTQSGIDLYNKMIGGESLEDGKKIQGFNEKVNLFRQANKLDGKSVPMLKQLRKQILGDKNVPSWVTEGFKNKDSMNTAVTEFYGKIKSVLSTVADIFAIENCDYSKIYIKSRFLADISHELFKDFSFLKNVLLEKYIANNTKSKNPEKDFLRIEYFTIADIQAVMSNTDKGFIFEYFYNKIINTVSGIRQFYELWTANQDSVPALKDLMDNILALHRTLKIFDVEGSDKDPVFYEMFDESFDELNGAVKLYNEVRNFITKKPYSLEKIKLNFGNSTLLSGWDVNKETDNASVLLRKGDYYYLGIMDEEHNKIFKNAPLAEIDEESYEKMDYKLLPKSYMMLPKVSFSKGNASKYEPSKEILRIYENGSFKAGENFSIDDLHALIDFYKDSIAKNPEWVCYKFNFKPTEDYQKINEFYDDVDSQGYVISFRDIKANYIDKLVKEGKLYLFKIYNKDFSPYSKGTPNLHTLYFKMLFDERNLKNTVYKLNGGAEMFYRKKSLNYSEEMLKKGHHAEELKDKFNYPIIKDRRFAFDRFQFNVAVTLNPNALGFGNINDIARDFIRSNDANVIGIHRAENHLIYIVVLDSHGRIIEQQSLNEIEGYNGKKINYMEKLDERGKERDEARVNWQEIGNIKELKEGYLSNIISKIAALMVKHNAVCVMEDLSYNFIRERSAIEKQIYQKFEKMLIDKLNFYVDKKKNPEELGGLLKPLQLANKFVSFEKIGKESGMIFYVSPYKVTDIDPVTGFVNLFDTRYFNIDKSLRFFSKFKNINYNDKADWFEFSFDYSDFTDKDKIQSARTEWTVCTYGERIERFNENNQPKFRKVDLTKEFKALFAEYSIDYKGDLKESILLLNDKNFFVRLLSLFRITVQMRNGDYIISPVMDNSGKFYDSRKPNKGLPENAAANGAYNIARKGLILLDRIKQVQDIRKVDLRISGDEWLQYAQGGGL